MTSASDNLATRVDGMLQDAGLGQDVELRGVLLSLGSLAALPAPEPSGDLAALLQTGDAPRAGEPAPAKQPGDELARRRRRRHRPTALGLVLVAGMGLGVGGVAATSTVSGNNGVEHLLEEWAPWNRPATAAPAAPGYRATDPAAGAEPAGAASAAAPGGTVRAGSHAFRLLRDPSGVPAAPVCAGPLKHGPGTGAAACAAGSAASSTPDAAAGTSKDASGPSSGDRTPAEAAGAGAAAGTGAPAGPAGARTPEPNPAGGLDPGAPAQNAGSADNAGQAQSPPQGAGQGDGPGNGRTNAVPAK